MTAIASAGRIAADELYTLAEIKLRLGLGAAALRTARRRGLKVRKIGRRGFVLGKDVIAFIERDRSQEVAR
jgi:hypothetical protein